MGTLKNLVILVIFVFKKINKQKNIKKTFYCQESATINFQNWFSGIKLFFSKDLGILIGLLARFTRSR